VELMGSPPMSLAPAAITQLTSGRPGHLV